MYLPYCRRMLKYLIGCKYPPPRDGSDPHTQTEATLQRRSFLSTPAKRGKRPELTVLEKLPSLRGETLPLSVCLSGVSKRKGRYEDCGVPKCAFREERRVLPVLLGGGYSPRNSVPEKHVEEH